MRITESQLRKIVREEATHLHEGRPNFDTKKVLTLKKMVVDLLHLYKGETISDAAMDGIRDLVEKETGNKDIPLDYYEASDDRFLKLVLR
jgi:hypothetical protein